jgi:hypothetical protein
MSEPIVFFSRCKPQYADVIDIVLSERRIFIGHPMAREGATYNPKNLKSCVVDPSCEDDEWAVAHASSDKRRQFNQNRNLIRNVQKGSIAMVPRPSRGVIYCGKIISDFELEDAPGWYEKYMDIRGDTDGEDTWHAADVAQGWRVDQFKPIPVPRIAAWIRRSLFGRSTYGVIHPDQIGGDPYPVISRAIEGDGFEQREWTLDASLIEKRLINDLTPSTFEHLVVSLLQLEHPSEVWSQVGGSGDGGVDGVGAGQNGNVTGLLQCKWQYWGEEVFSTDSVWANDNRPLRKYLAALRYAEDVKPQGCIFLDRVKVASMIVQHHKRLPQALSMRIGVSP